MAGGGLFWLWQGGSPRGPIHTGPATILEPGQRKRKKKKSVMDAEIEAGRKSRQKEEEDLLMAILEFFK